MALTRVVLQDYAMLDGRGQVVQQQQQQQQVGAAPVVVAAAAGGLAPVATSVVGKN